MKSSWESIGNRNSTAIPSISDSPWISAISVWLQHNYSCYPTVVVDKNREIGLMTEVRNGGGLCFPNRDDDGDSSCPLQVSFSMEASAFKWNSEAAAYQVRSSINLYDSEEEARGKSWAQLEMHCQFTVSCSSCFPTHNISSTLLLPSSLSFSSLPLLLTWPCLFVCNLVHVVSARETVHDSAVQLLFY